MSVESRPMTDTLPHDKTAIGGPLRSTDLLSLAYAAKRVEILRRVRRTLKRMYRLPETKCAKFEPGKRTTLGDRPIALVSEAVLYDGLVDLPTNDPDALEALEAFLDAEDDIGSESELEYE